MALTCGEGWRGEARGQDGVDKGRGGRENAVDRRDGSATVLQVSSPGIQLLSCLEGTIVNSEFYYLN